MAKNAKEPVAEAVETPAAESAPAPQSSEVSSVETQPESPVESGLVETTEPVGAPSDEYVSREMYENMQTALHNERARRHTEDQGRLAPSYPDLPQAGASLPPDEVREYLQTAMQPVVAPLYQELASLRAQLQQSNEEKTRLQEWNEFVQKNPDIKEYSKEIESVVTEIATSNPDFTLDTKNLKFIYDAAKGRAKSRIEKEAADKATEAAYSQIAAKEESSGTAKGGKSEAGKSGSSPDIDSFSKGDEDAQAEYILKHVLKK